MNNPIFTKSMDIYYDLVNLAQNLTEKGISKNTRRAYEADFGLFAAFCYKHEKKYMPADAETVCAYLASIVKKKYSTISRICVSIKRFHVENGHTSPTDSQSVKDLLKGIRREYGIACDSAKPIMWEDLKTMVSNQDGTIRGRRNQAILLIGWCAALRRSEIVALDVSDLSFLSEGLILKIRRSKTDQEGLGRNIFIPEAPKNEMCCVRFMKEYEELLFLNRSGPLFRRVRKTNSMMFYDWGNAGRLTEQTITDIVKDAARLIGLSPLEYSAHSLRRGFATQCGRLGIPERFIQRQTRHESIEVLRKYIDDGSIMLNNPLTIIYSEMKRPLTTPHPISAFLPGSNSSALDSASEVEVPESSEPESESVLD
jgi:site-specific recombinase XerD